MAQGVYMSAAVCALSHVHVSHLQVCYSCREPHNDPIRNLECLKLLLQQGPTVQLPYLAPVSRHPARRRAAAQTAADADRGLALLGTLCCWECFRKVTALAQNNPMLESWTTFGSTL